MKEKKRKKWLFKKMVSSSAVLKALVDSVHALFVPLSSPFPEYWLAFVIQLCSVKKGH